MFKIRSISYKLSINEETTFFMPVILLALDCCTQNRLKNKNLVVKNQCKFLDMSLKANYNLMFTVATKPAKFESQ